MSTRPDRSAPTGPHMFRSIPRPDVDGLVAAVELGVDRVAIDFSLGDDVATAWTSLDNSGATPGRAATSTSCASVASARARRSMIVSWACGVNGLALPTKGRAVPHSRPAVSRVAQASWRVSTYSAIAGSVIRTALLSWRERPANPLITSDIALYQGSITCMSRCVVPRVRSASSRLRVTSGFQWPRTPASSALESMPGVASTATRPAWYASLRLLLGVLDRLGEVVRRLERALQRRTAAGGSHRWPRTPPCRRRRALPRAPRSGSGPRRA